MGSTGGKAVPTPDHPPDNILMGGRRGGSSGRYMVGRKSPETYLMGNLMGGAPARDPVCRVMGVSHDCDIQRPPDILGNRGNISQLGPSAVEG